MISQESNSLQGDVQFCGTLLRYIFKQVKKKFNTYVLYIFSTINYSFSE